MTSFTCGNDVIRFKTSRHLICYDSIVSWDKDGYIVCMATYDNSPTPEEEYIDLAPILANLYLDPEDFFEDIEDVRIAYA